MSRQDIPVPIACLDMHASAKPSHHNTSSLYIGRYDCTPAVIMLVISLNVQ